VIPFHSFQDKIVSFSSHYFFSESRIWSKHSYRRRTLFSLIDRIRGLLKRKWNEKNSLSLYFFMQANERASEFYVGTYKHNVGQVRDLLIGIVLIVKIEILSLFLSRESYYPYSFNPIFIYCINFYYFFFQNSQTATSTRTAISLPTTPPATAISMSTTTTPPATVISMSTTTTPPAKAISMPTTTTTTLPSTATSLPMTTTPPSMIILSVSF